MEQKFVKDGRRPVDQGYDPGRERPHRREYLPVSRFARFVIGEGATAAAE